MMRWILGGNRVYSSWLERLGREVDDLKFKVKETRQQVSRFGSIPFRMKVQEQPSIVSSLPPPIPNTTLDTDSENQNSNLITAEILKVITQRTNETVMLTGV